MTSLKNPSVLDNLDETQLEAVTSTAGHLAILAGAGSGKTRVLTRRIAWRAAQKDLDPTKTVAVTFTRKAAGELGQRLASLAVGGIKTGTFHSLAYAQLHKRWAQRKITPPQLLDRKIGFVARLLPKGDKNLPLDVTSELEWASARALTEQTYRHATTRAKRTPPLPMAEMITILKRYKEEKRARRLVDFDDLLWLAIRDLNDEQFADEVASQQQHFFVDEFQDINPLQFNLLKAWLNNREDLCVVGDPNQAIYGWNGADASYLQWFENKFHGAQTIQLGHNYRSTSQVITAGHSVLPSNMRTKSPPIAHQPEGEKPQIHSYATDVDEAKAIALATKKAYEQGTTYSEQAILVRTNAQTALLAEQCRKQNVPVSIKGGSSLTSQPEVKELLRALRQTTELQQGFSILKDAVERQKPSDDASVAETTRHANRLALVRLASDHLDTHPESTTVSFIELLQATIGRDHLSAASQSVEIMTFHAAKGLEWTTVYVAGLEYGLVPIGYADTPAELAEERRLLHVAFTRAKRQLVLSWSEQRQFGEKTTTRKRSPYLDALSPPPKKAAASKKKPVSQSLLKPDLPADDPLYKALVDWRRDRAEQDLMPAYIVFNNRTLAAIVRLQPQTEKDLLAVPGIGPAKVERYGKAVLQLVTELT